MFATCVRRQGVWTYAARGREFVCVCVCVYLCVTSGTYVWVMYLCVVILEQARVNSTEIPIGLSNSCTLSTTVLAYSGAYLVCVCMAYVLVKESSQEVFCHVCLSAPTGSYM